MRLLIAALGFAGGFFYGLANPAFAHDHYGGVYEKNDRAGAGGILCCGDNPETGDCEGLTWEQIEAQPDGGVRIFSKRYGASVLIAEPKIFWGIMLDSRSGEAAYPGDPYAAHWCGKPRSKMGYGGGDNPEGKQPDPLFWTLCAFVKSGGV